MPDQLLSTDPNAGRLLSTDPSAGVAAEPVPDSADAMRGPLALAHGSSPSDLAAMLGPLAHPQTLTDFARILTLPVDSVRKAAIYAVGMAAARPVTQPVGDAVSAAVKPGLDLVKGAATSGMRLVGKAVDSVNPDLVSIVSPRAGAALKMAQRASAVLNTPAAAAESAAVAPEAAAVTPAAAESFSPVLTSGTPSTSIAPKVFNELAIQARRAGIKLTAPEEAASAALVQQGAPAQQAIAALVKARTAAPLAAKLTLSAEETALGQSLVGKGVSQPQALQAILNMRKLKGSAAMAGTPSSAEVAASVAARNATGRWPE